MSKTKQSAPAKPAAPKATAKPVPAQEPELKYVSAEIDRSRSHLCLRMNWSDGAVSVYALDNVKTCLILPEGGVRLDQHDTFPADNIAPVLAQLKAFF